MLYHPYHIYYSLIARSNENKNGKADEGVGGSANRTHKMCTIAKKIEVRCEARIAIAYRTMDIYSVILYFA